MISRNIKMVGQYFGDGFIMIIFKPVFDRIDRIFLDIYFLAFRKVMKQKIILLILSKVPLKLVSSSLIPALEGSGAGYLGIDPWPAFVIDITAAGNFCIQ
jgi:hypothetical protein